jgi:hypothetical protein
VLGYRAFTPARVLPLRSEVAEIQVCLGARIASLGDVVELVPHVEAFIAIFRFLYQHEIERKIGQGFSPAVTQAPQLSKQHPSASGIHSGSRQNGTSPLREPRPAGGRIRASGDRESLLEREHPRGGKGGMERTRHGLDRSGEAAGYMAREALRSARLGSDPVAESSTSNDTPGRSIQGGVRYCVFSTGTFEEPIAVSDPPSLLRFDVSSNPPPMRELSFTRTSTA